MRDGIEGRLREEGGIHIQLRTFRVGGLQTIAHREIEQYLAIGGELGTDGPEATARDIHRRLLAAGIDQRDVEARYSGADGGGKPAAIGRPHEGQVAIRVGIGKARGHGGDRLLGREVHHHEAGAVFEVGNALAIGRVGRLGDIGRGVGEPRFLQSARRLQRGRARCIDGRLVSIVAAIAFGGIEHGLAIGAEAHVALVLRRVGDAAGATAGRVHHEDFASGDDGDFRAVLVRGDLGHFLVHLREEGAAEQRALADVDLDAFGFLRVVIEPPDFAVVAIHEVVLAGAAQEAHRMRLVRGDLHRLRIAFKRHFPHVETAGLLVEPEHRFPIGAEHRIAILAAPCRELAMFFARGVVNPDVPRGLRDGVLAPLVLPGVEARVEDETAIRTRLGVERRRGKDQPLATSCDGNGIKLDRGAAEDAAEGHFRIAEPHRAKEHRLSIRRESVRRVRLRMRGESPDLPALRRHDEDVRIAMPVRAERDALAIGRPHRMIRHELRAGQRHRLAAASGHPPKLSAVNERDVLPVGRNGGAADP